MASPPTSTTQKKQLKVAIVGAGPSGLLLAHALLSAQQQSIAADKNDHDIHVTLIEGRSDPHNLRKRNDDEKGDTVIDGRAYALGLGIRGRTAIQKSVDGDTLWRAVKRRGFESERFQLHVGPFVIPLRSEQDSKNNVEPSLLIYQSELCAALLEELDNSYGLTSEFLQVEFDSKVTTCELDEGRIQVEKKKTTMDAATKRNILTDNTFDLIVGCDGVNSVVRQAMAETASSWFESTVECLPGEFKVVRLDQVPASVDPKSVSLILPKQGSCGAFVEPTGTNECCILFSGRDNSDSPILSETTNQTAIVEELEKAFPKWGDGAFSYDSIATQLMKQQTPGSASSVVCNTYHYRDKAVLVGDAAHATGGVSGQGVNSALVDSVVLAQSILTSRRRDTECDTYDLDAAVLSYSMSQVPEGKALYDLSFGPNPKGLKGLVYAFQTARDTLFRGRWGIGRPPLQTQLTTDLSSFASLRRDRDRFYDAPFGTDSDFQAQLTALHQKRKAGKR